MRAILVPKNAAYCGKPSRGPLAKINPFSVRKLRRRKGNATGSGSTISSVPGTESGQSAVSQKYYRRNCYGWRVPVNFGAQDASDFTYSIVAWSTRRMGISSRIGYTRRHSAHVRVSPSASNARGFLQAGQTRSSVLMFNINYSLQFSVYSWQPARPELLPGRGLFLALIRFFERARLQPRRSLSSYKATLVAEGRCPSAAEAALLVHLTGAAEAAPFQTTVISPGP
jgi:hypothetical protein